MPSPTTRFATGFLTALSTGAVAAVVFGTGLSSAPRLGLIVVFFGPTVMAAIAGWRWGWWGLLGFMAGLAFGVMIGTAAIALDNGYIARLFAFFAGIGLVPLIPVGAVAAWRGQRRFAHKDFPRRGRNRRFRRKRTDRIRP